MYLYPKTLVVAAMLSATFSMATQITSAFSAGTAIDCNGPKRAGKDCPAVVTPAPPAPPAGEIKSPPPSAPAVTNNINTVAPPPPVTNNNPPPPVVGNPPPANQATGWQNDRNRQHRRNYRDNVFRFSFGGFFYDQPYWEQQQNYQQSYRISCGEGRGIVADEGFNRVRTVECNGRTFTYQARRGNRIFRVFVNSRRGTISGITRRY